jgi:hypothetical protein
MTYETINNNLDLSKLARPTKDVFIFVDTKEYTETDKVKIYFQHEPVAINNSIINAADNWQRYDIIITYNTYALTKAPNALFHFFYSPTWIHEKDYMNIDTSLKAFKVSSLTGFKQMCKAHIFRQELYINQKHFDSNIFTFFKSSAGLDLPSIQNNPIMGIKASDKIELFKTFQFSMIIENTREANCFTEKLIDCLITKTMPIYYGCENIDIFFNTKGWIIIEDTNIHEVLHKVSVLNEHYYSEYTEIIEENYKKAFEYKDIYARFNHFLKNLPAPYNGLFV